MTWLLLGALALAGLLVLVVVGSAFGLVWFLVTLPFRLLAVLIRIPFILFGLAVAGIVLTLLVFLPIAFLLTPALVTFAVAYGVWRLVRRSRSRDARDKAIPAA